MNTVWHTVAVKNVKKAVINKNRMENLLEVMDDGVRIRV